MRPGGILGAGVASAVSPIFSPHMGFLPVILATVAADLVLMRMDITLGATQPVSGWIWWPSVGDVTLRHVVFSVVAVVVLALLASLAADRVRGQGVISRVKRQVDVLGAEDCVRGIAGVALVPAVLGWLLSLAGQLALRTRE